MNIEERVVSYERVSTQSQVDNGCGLETQRKRILEYAQERGLSIVKHYCDEGISGAVRDRPALIELLTACESGKVNKVIVYKMDRLARELTVSLWLEAQFKKHNVEVLSVVDPELGDDPLEKAFRRIAFIFAELEKDVITARLRDGRVNKAKKGERGSGPVPYGYKKVDGKLEIDENESVWVEKIFRWRSRGFKYSKIIKELNKRSVFNKKGKIFQIESIKYLLKNSIYWGESNFGEIKRSGNHCPIISKRLYAKVQKIM